MGKSRKIDIDVSENLLDILDAIDCDIKPFIQSFLDGLTSSDSNGVSIKAKEWAVQYCNEYGEETSAELLDTISDICPEFKG